MVGSLELSTNRNFLGYMSGMKYYPVMWFIINHDIRITTVDGRNPAQVSNPTIYRVLDIPGGAGFLPSTVLNKQYFIENKAVFFCVFIF